MLREHGTLPLRDVLRFAIGYAEDGYPAVAAIGDGIRRVEQLFRDDWTTSVDVYLPIPEPGTLHRNRKLAATYRRILEEAEAASTDRDVIVALSCRKSASFSSAKTSGKSRGSAPALPSRSYAPFGTRAW